MWSWAENNETKQGKVNYFLRWNIMAKSKKVKNGQLYPGISDFTTNLNIPDVPPSNTASFGHLWKSYLASHFSMTIHTFYGQCTSLKAINNCSQKKKQLCYNLTPENAIACNMYLSVVPFEIKLQICWNKFTFALSSPKEAKKFCYVDL